MEQSFKPKNFYWTGVLIYIILTLLFLASLFLIKELFQGAPIPVAIAYLIVLSVLFYGISKSTYRIIVTNEGTLIEKSWFHKNRTLSVSEIESIAPRRFASDSAVQGARLYGVTEVEAPKILNAKYKNFPKYIMPLEFVKYIKEKYPSVKIDPNINLKF